MNRRFFIGFGIGIALLFATIFLVGFNRSNLAGFSQIPASVKAKYEAAGTESAPSAAENSGLDTGAPVKIAVNTQRESGDTNLASDPIGALWRWPQTTPALDVFTELTAAAAAGSVRAKCIVAEAHIHCQQLQRDADHHSILMQQEMLSLNGDDLQTADALARSRHALSKSQLFCAQLPVQAPQLGSYLRAAATAGQRGAMFRYVEGSFLNFSTPAFLARPDFDLWRTESLRIAEKMLALGYAEILPVLNDAYQNDSTPFAAIVPDNSYSARRLDLVQQAIFDASPTTEALTDRRAERSAQASAQQMTRTTFANRRLQLDQNLGPPTGLAWSPQAACQN